MNNDVSKDPTIVVLKELLDLIWVNVRAFGWAS